MAGFIDQLRHLQGVRTLAVNTLSAKGAGNAAVLAMSDVWTCIEEKVAPLVTMGYQ
jgi:hypothetical protein